jgi:hypothetical protein
MPFEEAIPLIRFDIKIHLVLETLLPVSPGSFQPNLPYDSLLIVAKT